MNAPVSPDLRAALESVQLDDKYILESGRAWMSGIHALVRLPMMQRMRDQQAGLNTAGFVSGYRGSPLGGVDQNMWKAAAHLKARHIEFQPGVNEDLAATAVWGSQQVNLFPGAKYDGVFGMWYGKGPGVDRCGDVFKHANAAGTARHGGVLVVVGDDHTAVSSSIPHASEASLIGWQMPIVHPASIDEYETFALWGWALSRHSGTWVAFKAVSETIESGHSFTPAQPVSYDMPADPDLPPESLEYSARDFLSLAVETRMNLRMRAVAAFARRHSIDRLVCAAPKAAVGIVTVGKAHLDTMEALSRLGVDTVTANAPVRIYKPGLTWPLDAERLLAFARGLSHILVVEEKGAVVESQIKDLLFNLPDRPTVIGKKGFDGKPMVPSAGQLRPSLLARPLAGWLSRAAGLPLAADLAAFECQAPLSNDADGMRRRPYFCSGCPHSTSTKVPEGSQALSGVGCHYMAAWMDRDTGGLTQMGGEGVDWIGLSRYTEMPHIFQNMGEGTYYHSGYLAIRQAVAARANITYKILFNDAVAMTGGQPVDGPISVPQICQQLRGENVARIVVTSDEPEKYQGVDLGPGIKVHHRRELDALQRELREIPGVTVLIHDQTCAAEKRRRRKKNQFPDPARRLLINSAVCEGCGDCGVQSNCLSVVPLETPYGRKRAIDQSSCNKDFSCLKGFCPSFVTVEGGRLKRPQALAQDGDIDAGIAPPAAHALDRPYGVFIAGVGGTGVVTIGQLLGMAAHIEGKGCSVLDMAGLAQKGGAVYSHVVLARTPDDLLNTRVAMGEADLLLAGDLVVATSMESMARLAPGRTRVLLNGDTAPTAAFVANPDWTLPGANLTADLQAACGKDNLDRVDAAALAVGLLGDAIYANPLMMGYAYQKGWIPLSREALLRAIELNGQQVPNNIAAFAWGRRAARDPAGVNRLLAEGGARPALPEGIIELKRPRKASPVVELKKPADELERLVAVRKAFLTDYQHAAYARQYTDLVDKVAHAEREATGTNRLALAVARGYFKLMAYKDEYEVARLYTAPAFQAQLDSQFEGDYSLRFHMAPPIFARKDPRTGVPRKVTLGPRTMTALKALARLKGLRGTWFDPFGRTAERRMERALIGEYRQTVQQLLAGLNRDNIGQAATIAALAETIRGYGHVKAASVEKYRTELSRLMQSYTAPAPHDMPLRKTA